MYKNNGMNFRFPRSMSGRGRAGSFLSPIITTYEVTQEPSGPPPQQNWSPSDLGEKLTGWWGQYGNVGASRDEGVDILDSDSNDVAEFLIDTGDDLGFYTDASNDRDFRAGADAQRPAIVTEFGFDVCDFDATGAPDNDFVNTNTVGSTFFPDTNKGGYCVVYFPKSISSNANSAATLTADASRLLGDNDGYWGAYLTTTGVWAFQFSGVGIKFPAGATLDVPHVLVVKWDTDTMTAACDDTVFFDAAISGGPASLAGNLRIGGQSNGFNGYILEMFTFSSATVEDLEEMISYAQTRWGI